MWWRFGSFFRVSQSRSLQCSWVGSDLEEVGVKRPVLGSVMTTIATVSWSPGSRSQNVHIGDGPVMTPCWALRVPPASCEN